MTVDRTAGGWPSGVLLVDKPPQVTSHGVVGAIRRRAGTRKVGHAGTLDPAATGLLLIGIGTATRLLTYLVGLDKEYTATIRLGSATTTDDADGELVSRAAAEELTCLTDERVRESIAGLTGSIDQVPSSVSAIKVDGKRAYARVRDGETVRLQPRTVTVHVFDLLGMSRPEEDAVDLDVRVECSSGTYIRALARDLGAGLGVGGHLTALRRIRVGPFAVGDALAPDHPELATRLLDPATTASALFERIDLDAAQAVDLGHGKQVPLDGPADSPGPIAAVSPAGRLVGLVEVRSGRARSLVNFPEERTHRQ